MVKFQFCLHVFVCLVGSLQAVQKLRSSNSILNSNFVNKKILEDEIKFTKAYRASMCAFVCTDTIACLSFAYNKQTQTCVLFDKDFTDVNLTQTVAEDGWNYSYIVRDYEGRRNPCFAPPMDGICSLFCLHFVHLHDDYFYSNWVCQSFYGGEMVKVDRGLKQYCVEKIMRGFSVFIQGRRNETTNKWTYDDGTEITYFNWDTVNGQPSNATGDTFIGIFPYFGYMWHATNDFWDDVHGTVCQQT